jgi:hypothetical protein
LLIPNDNGNAFIRKPFHTLGYTSLHPVGAREGRKPLWPGPELPRDWTDKLAVSSSDAKLRDAFLDASFNTTSKAVYRWPSCGTRGR